MLAGTYQGDIMRDILKIDQWLLARKSILLEYWYVFSLMGGESHLATRVAYKICSSG